MKILITAPSLDEHENVSGISTVVRQILKHGSAEYRHFLAGRKDGEGAGPEWLLRQAALPFRFRRELRSFEPDAVHVNTAMTSQAILRDAALVAAARRAKTPVVVAVHGGRYLMEDCENSLVRAAASKMLRNASAVLVLSEIEKTEIEKRWNVPNVRVLPNAVPLVQIERGARNERPALIFLARMHESKGLDEIVTATRELKAKGIDFVFRAYGEGPRREDFVSRMQKILGPDFEYRGVATGDEKWAALSQADILLLPSRYGEGLPMSMLEAMAAGCVVVAGDVTSVRSVIDDGVNGFLVRPGDAKQLTEILERVLNEPSRWGSIGEKAKHTVRENFAIERYIGRLENIYREVAR